MENGEVLGPRDLSEMPPLAGPKNALLPTSSSAGMPSLADRASHLNRSASSVASEGVRDNRSFG